MSGSLVPRSQEALPRVFRDYLYPARLSLSSLRCLSSGESRPGPGVLQACFSIDSEQSATPGRKSSFLIGEVEIVPSSDRT